MTMERKAERTAKFNKNKKSKTKQKSKRYKKEKKEYTNDFENSRISWDTDKL